MNILKTSIKLGHSMKNNYILELMVIEADSRRYVKDAIDAEKDLTLLESCNYDRHKSPVKDRQTKLKQARCKLIQCISKINSVANTNGKGRDDLTYEILEIADKRRLELSTLNLSTKLINSKSSFHRLHENMKSTLANLRILLAKYSENIEVVDPQLKNNTELVEWISDFENVWSKGKLFLIDDNRFKCFIILSQYIEYLTNEYEDFKALIEWRDYELFMVIPTWVIQSVVFEIIKENMDKNNKFSTEDKPVIKRATNFVNILHTFWPELVSISETDSSQFELKGSMIKLVVNIYEIISNFQSLKDYTVNGVQKMIEINTIKGNLENLNSVYQNLNSKDMETLCQLKWLSVDLQRSKPSEWNELLDICIQ